MMRKQKETVTPSGKEYICPYCFARIDMANVHYLCTEYGCVNLKGLTSWEKAEALISVAHPDFREELIREADKLHIWRRSNKI